MSDKGVKRYDRARFNCLIMQRDLESEIQHRAQKRAEADGQKSDGETEVQTAQ